MTPQQGDTIAVWFSCGAASAIAARLTVDRYGSDYDVRVVNNPVAEEDPDNRRFLDDVADWLNVEIEDAKSSRFPSASAVDIWDARKAMAFPMGAPCTIELKKRARQEWEAANSPDWHVLGFTAEERHRHDRFVLTERENVLPVLLDARIGKAQAMEMLTDAGISLPAVYRRGYPNANCIGCVKASSPTYWNHVRQQDPETFAARAEQSRRLGAKLVRVNNERIFLDELHPAAIGRPMVDALGDCGIFCEERT